MFERTVKLAGIVVVSEAKHLTLYSQMPSTPTVVAVDEDGCPDAIGGVLINSRWPSVDG